MPKFKNPVTGEVIEVEEEFAAQVLRPQRKYVEVVNEPGASKSRDSAVSDSGTKRASKKANRKPRSNATGAE